MKVFVKYLCLRFLTTVTLVSSIFFFVILVINLIEEVNFFKNTSASIYYPVVLDLLNSPSILYKLFPFIFLISTQLVIINLKEKNEIITLKNFGVDNFKMIQIFSILSFLLGLFIIIVFYNFSSKLKYTYLDLKNDFSTDDKYLAAITENGLWIKDENDENINIINGERIKGNYLVNVSISQFDKSYNIQKIITSGEVDIKEFIWKIDKAILYENNTKKDLENFNLITNFNLEKIKNLFENLESLTIFELHKLDADYNSVGYSTKDLNLHLQEIYSYPIYLTIMTLLSLVIMFKTTSNRPKIFYIFLGILVSVIIFYINHFMGLLGENNKLPIYLATWLPKLLILLFTSIYLVNINEN